MPGLPRSILGLPGALSFTAATRSDTTTAGLDSGRDSKREREREREGDKRKRRRTVSVSFSYATWYDADRGYERTESKAPKHEDGIPPARAAMAAPTSSKPSSDHTRTLLAVSRCRRLRPTTRVDRCVADVMRAIHRLSDRRINGGRTNG